MAKQPPKTDLGTPMVAEPPSTLDVIMGHMSRASYVAMINGAMEAASRLGESLQFQEDILLNKERFARLSIDSQLSVYNSTARRHHAIISSINHVFGLAVRNDFNRNFFGIPATDIQPQGNKAEEVADLPKNVRMILSQISKQVHVGASEEKPIDIETSEAPKDE